MSLNPVLMNFVRMVASGTKHGPYGSGGAGPCDEKCVKCEAERLLAEATKPSELRRMTRADVERLFGAAELTAQDKVNDP